MNIQSLNGEWTLYYYPAGEVKTEALGEALSALAKAGSPMDLPHVTAMVPGNVELDLSRAGVLPADLFFGENLLEAEAYEDHEWWYVREFDAADVAEPATLVFNGVDCLAEYFLNGKKIGASENALIPVSLDVAGVLCVGTNKLAVHIIPITQKVQDSEYTAFLTRNTFNLNPESVYIRKPPHAFGWDIMPRAVTAGLWRDVSLQTGQSEDFKELLLYVEDLKRDSATLRLAFDSNLPYRMGKSFAEIRIEGRCGDHSFSVCQAVHFKAGQIVFEVKNPKLWWPYGYGDPSLYDLDIKLVMAGQTYAAKKMRFGIRTVKLERTEHTDKKNLFRFRINGEPVMVKGSNWVPLDAYHSRDKERMQPALDMMADIGCNMVRCWGGNVYEPNEFYDFCDEKGMMVWQDFSMACHAYPQDDAFLKVIEEEATAIVRRLRNYASIVLWSGDNENDVMMWNCGSNPDENLITRKILPEVIKNHDSHRPYLPSSPFVTGAQFEAGAYDYIGEDHLWGPRDYFKSTFYMSANASFTSEIGYHGCPSVESLKKYISEENLSNINHPQWVLHSADQRRDTRRINLMARQVEQLFGTPPESLEDFVTASQITQAEAKKFFIEHMRLGKPEKNGILWWNLLDGWPQISDAVVDYYHDKKLAYHYIKNSQAPFAIMADEIDDWHQAIVASNDTLQEVTGTYTVRDGETNEVLLEGSFSAPSNTNVVLGRLPVMYSKHALLVMDWDTNLGKGHNHYVCGLPPLDFARYTKWLPLILGQ